MKTREEYVRFFELILEQDVELASIKDKFWAYANFGEAAITFGVMALMRVTRCFPGPESEEIHAMKNELIQKFKNRVADLYKQQTGKDIE